MSKKVVRILTPEEADQRYITDLPERLSEERLEQALSTRSAFSGLPLQTRGNSWIEYGSYDTQPYPAYLPDLLGFSEVINRGRAGRRTQDNAQIMVSTQSAYPYDTNFRGVLLINDLGNNLIEDDTLQNRAAAYQGMRAMVALASASSRVDQTGWTFRNNGSGEAWNDESAQPYASGGTARIGVFSGLQVDIPVNAGTSYLLCHGLDPAMARGASIKITQGARTVIEQTLDAQTVVTPNEANYGASPVVIRMDNLQAGTVTATTDQKGVNGSLAIVDGMLPQSSTPPFIILVKPPTLTSPTHNKPDLNAYLRSIPDLVAAEFGRHILVVDPQPGFDAATMLGADQLHPTRLGTKHVNDAIVSAIKARAWERLLRS